MPARKLSEEELKASEIERFERLYIPEPMSGCWLWLGYVGKSGYGYFRYRRQTRLAHRFVCDTPRGMDSDHTCRVRSCVNPDHIETVTRSENISRSPLMKKGGRPLKSHCKWGHPLSGVNLSLTADGYRRCKQCARDRTQRHYMKKKTKEQTQ